MGISRRNDMMNALCIFCNENNVNISVAAPSTSFLTHLSASFMSIFGGGASAHGVVGNSLFSSLAPVAMTDDLRSLSEIIERDLNEEQKRELHRRINNAIEDYDVSTVEEFLSLLRSNRIVRKIVLDIIVEFAENLFS